MINKLIGSTPMHLSPFEHQARPFLNTEEKYEYSSNFHFFQQRKAIEKIIMAISQSTSRVKTFRQTVETEWKNQILQFFNI